MILLLATVNWLSIQANRWDKAEVRLEKAHFVQAIAAQIERNKARYVEVSKKSNVPWQVIASIHSMEASLNFRCNLANGDPLTAKTRHVPIGRPTGHPPFSWEYAAEDSLDFDNMGRLNWTDVCHKLQNIEKYNGLGVQKYHPQIPSCYLWNWSTIELPGKYIEDGQWSATARSQQAGAAMILKELK